MFKKNLLRFRCILNIFDCALGGLISGIVLAGPTPGTGIIGSEFILGICGKVWKFPSGCIEGIGLGAGIDIEFGKSANFGGGLNSASSTTSPSTLTHFFVSAFQTI